MKEKLTFSTTPAWDLVDGFGCASLGLAGVSGNEEKHISTYQNSLEGVVLCGSYNDVLKKTREIAEPVFAAIVLFGNAGGENGFLLDLQKIISCPMVGGGAAIDPASGKSRLLTGGGEVAIFLITDDRFRYRAVAQSIHNNILDPVHLELADPRTILTINGIDAATFLAERRKELALDVTDFEHLTISDYDNVNAHLSCVDGVVRSGRDLQENMLLRFVDHECVYESIRAFYDDENAIVFGCAGLSGLLDCPLDTKSLGLYLFGEVCTANGKAEFGNLMLSKLIIE